VSFEPSEIRTLLNVLLARKRFVKKEKKKRRRGGEGKGREGKGKGREARQYREANI